MINDWHTNFDPVTAADLMAVRIRRTAAAAHTSSIARFRRLGLLTARKEGRAYIYDLNSVRALAAKRHRWVSHPTAGPLTNIPASTVSRAVARGELHPRDVHGSVPLPERYEVLR